MNLRNNKGAITLYVVIAMVAFMLFAIATYTFISRRNQTQIEITSEIKNIYDNANDEEAYNNYFKNGYIPIYSGDDLKKIASNENVSITKENGKIYTFSPNATYVIMNDIDLNLGKHEITEDMVISFNEDAEEWVPIGGENTFTGVLEGNGHTIYGLYINGTSNNIGLIKNASGAIIHDLKLQGKITGSNYVGGLVANATSCKIRNCECDIAVTGQASVGGIIGEARNCDMYDCINRGAVSGYINVGGIIGYGEANIVNKVRNVADITGTSQIAGIIGIATKDSVSGVKRKNK